MTFDLDPSEKSKESILPSLYQAHHQEYTEDLPFWLDLARLFGDPILELGCGTGRVLFHLEDAGYSCLGLDNDPAMLDQLRKVQKIRKSPPAPTILADMTAFQIQERFSLIILPCNTYSTLGSSARKSTLNCINQHLLSRGAFATSIPNPEILNTIETADQPEIEMFFPHPETGNPVQVSCWLVRNTEKITFHWYYDHLYPDGQVKRVEVVTSHHLTTTDQYLEEFHSAGYQVEAVYGDFDYSPLGFESPNLIIIAQKI